MGITFGTDGWRGILAADFTFAGVRAVARAIADYLKAAEPGRTCLIGYDHRFLAAEMAATAAAELAAHGVPALVSDGPIATPVLACAILDRGAGGAIMFTASHNPPLYQGMKFIPSYGGPATADITGSLEAGANAYLATASPAGPGRAAVETFDPVGRYWERLANLVDLEAAQRAGLRLGLDAMYGVGGPYLARLGGDNTIRLHFARDPLFGGLTPEPNAEHLQELIALVAAGQVQLGLATDGDADRFGAVDGRRSYLTPNQVLVLSLWYLLEQRGMRGAAVARTVATTHLLDRIAAAHGLDVIETPVGFKHVGQALLHQDALLGGEESGGMGLKGHVPEKDGILVCFLLAEMVARTGRSLGQLLDEIEGRFGALYNRRIDVHLSGPGERERISQALRTAPPDALGGQAVTAMDTVDGFRFRLAGGAWALLRFSGTEPLVRLYGEASMPAELAAVLADAGKVVAR